MGEMWAELPDAVLAGLRGISEAADQVTILGTADADGQIRFALLSRSEIAVLDPGRLRLGLWAESHSAANLGRTGRATLFRVDAGSAVSILLDCGPPVPLAVPGRALVGFEARVRQVRGDRAGYAELTGVLTFEVGDPEAVRAHWLQLERALFDTE